MFSVDKDHVPFIYQRISGALDDSDIARFVDMLRWFDENETRRHYVVTDARGCEMPNAKIRARLGEVMKQHDNPKLRNIVGMCFSSRVVSGAMTALRWLVPARLPEGYFATNADALAFISRYATQDGLVVPEGFRQRVIAA